MVCESVDWSCLLSRWSRSHAALNSSLHTMQNQRRLIIVHKVDAMTPKTIEDQGLGFMHKAWAFG